MVRFPAQLLHNKTVGIFGIGAIAEALAPKCKAFGMRVVGISSAPRTSPASTACDRQRRACQGRRRIRFLRAADAADRKDPQQRRREGIRRDEADELSHQSRARRRRRRSGFGRGAEGAAASPARRSTCSTRSRCRADHPFWAMDNVIITTHQGGFCDVYIDHALPTVETNMQLLPHRRHRRHDQRRAALVGV